MTAQKRILGHPSHNDDIQIIKSPVIHLRSTIREVKPCQLFICMIIVLSPCTQQYKDIYGCEIVIGHCTWWGPRCHHVSN